ncbi:unnamed protein product [Staurois parvus]|uniref:Uncharacterized protein n=1 Tax=Staurois parvus TaxID=386267 RepID=A0ABN9EKI8_9NEOB|nr:unnamed protein product [Staurois parvus]
MAVVNSLVPCDLCDHSQISHVVSNDVTSDILLTTLHVITDWPISDHDWDLMQRSRPTIGVSLCPEDTAGTGSRCCVLPGSLHS